MNLTAEQIKIALKGALNGPESHKKMLPPNRALNVAPRDLNGLKKSSVILLLFNKHQMLHALLIKRPVHMKHHAGQIALPGGRIEPNETALDTALRETFEEIGIQPEQIEVLGALSNLYVEVSRFLIHPFVGWLNQLPELNICKAEVDKVLHFPISEFREDIFATVQLTTITGKLEVPCIKFEDEIIWGATAMILAEFTDLLSA